MVQAYCAAVDLPYAQCGLLDSYRQALRQLDAGKQPAWGLRVKRMLDAELVFELLMDEGPTPR